MSGAGSGFDQRTSRSTTTSTITSSHILTPDSSLEGSSERTELTDSPGCLLVSVPTNFPRLKNEAAVLEMAIGNSASPATADIVKFEQNWEGKDGVDLSFTTRARRENPPPKSNDIPEYVGGSSNGATARLVLPSTKDSGSLANLYHSSTAYKSAPRSIRIDLTTPERTEQNSCRLRFGSSYWIGPSSDIRQYGYVPGLQHIYRTYINFCDPGHLGLQMFPPISNRPW